LIGAHIRALAGQVRDEPKRQHDDDRCDEEPGHHDDLMPSITQRAAPRQGGRRQETARRGDSSGRPRFQATAIEAGLGRLKQRVDDNGLQNQLQPAARTVTGPRRKKAGKAETSRRGNGDRKAARGEESNVEKNQKDVR
jgi:hypothetical protein